MRHLQVRERDGAVADEGRGAVPFLDGDLAQLHTPQLEGDLALTGQQPVLLRLLLRLDGNGARLRAGLLQPKVVWVGPYQRLILYPTAIQNATYVKNAKEGALQGDASIKASTAEGAILPMDVTVAWHVQPDDVVKAFQEFGTAEPSRIESIYLRWATSAAVNTVSGSHSIFDVISKDRAQIGPEVKAKILGGNFDRLFPKTHGNTKDTKDTKVKP